MRFSMNVYFINLNRYTKFCYDRSTIATRCKIVPFFAGRRENDLCIHEGRHQTWYIGLSHWVYRLKTRLIYSPGSHSTSEPRLYYVEVGIFCELFYSIPFFSIVYHFHYHFCWANVTNFSFESLAAFGPVTAAEKSVFSIV